MGILDSRSLTHYNGAPNVKRSKLKRKLKPR
jgi:hypothetical protein